MDMDVQVEPTPTETYLELVTLQSNVLLEAARRCAESLPGLYEVLQDDVMVTAGGTTRRALGWFRQEAWRHGDRPLHELFVNADRSGAHPGVTSAEDVLVTLLHEACHVYAHANGIQDTSREGRYHNRLFGQLAVAIGLKVLRHPVIGHETPSLTPSARVEYADLLGQLERGLVLAREPRTQVVGPHGSTRPSKYVFASCQRAGARGSHITIRVARGSWRPGTIRCSVCDSWFVESPSSTSRAVRAH